MIYALTIRSSVALGSLIEIKAPKLPGSYQLITAKQIPGENSLANFSVPVLAEKKLSHIGQPVAILTGPERTRLEELAAGIEVIADEEKPVFLDSSGESDAIVKREIVHGEPDLFFGEMTTLVSGSYTTGIQEHWYPEAHGALVIPPRPKTGGSAAGHVKRRDTETFTVHTASQWPFHVKNSVARVLGLNSTMVKIYPSCLAAHLDGKIWYPSLVACHAALAAWIRGSPVKLLLTREEDFIFSPKRNRSDIEIKSSLGERGEILSSLLKLKLDLGAFGVFEDEIIDQSCIGALGAYNHRSFAISGAGIRSNIPVQGPMAGFGLSQGLFAAERHFSHIADSIGQDPAEWRKQNYSGINLAIGMGLKEKAPLPELIDSVTAMSDYRRKWASYELLRRRRREETWTFTGDPLRGIGISTGFQGNGFLNNDEGGSGNCAAELTLEKDGTLEIKTSVIPSGGNETWLILADEILGVNPKMVKFNNSVEVPDSGAGTLSRNIGLLTRLVERCCTAIKKQRFRDPLPITVKRSLKPGKAPGLVPNKKIDPESFSRPGWAAAVVEIEIDQITLEPKIRGVWLAVDGGRIISMRRSHWTLRTGIIQALGWASREQLYYREGKISADLYRGYNITSLSEIPPIFVDFIRNDTDIPKGIGDLPFCCVPAAYVQAASQAMDHHFQKIPLSAMDILEAGRQKLTEQA